MTMFNRPRSGGDSWLSGGSSNGNLFGGGPQLTRQNGNIYGNSQNNSSSSGNLFGSNNNSNNNMFQSNNSGGLFGNAGQNSFGTFSQNFNINSRPKTREGAVVFAVSADYKDKNLDILRVEDYFACKNNKVPSQTFQALQNQWQKNKQGASGNGGMLGQSSGGLFGGNNNNNNGGGLFGSSGNGGLFGNNNNNNGNNNLFGRNNNNNGGGMFGNSNNNNGGGLFGNQNKGGLFGNNNNNGGGLFGNQNKGGLFGNSGNNNGGGLFGNNNNNNGGGLFGNQNKGGLFGNNSGGGLFGNNNNNNGGGGLFGNNNNNNNNGGGLFGNRSGGLFGNNNNNNNGGGLFGGSSGGGLFSGMNRNNGGGLFNSNNNNNNNNNNNGAFYGIDPRLIFGDGGLLDYQQAQFFELIRMNFGNTKDNYNLFGKNLKSSETMSETSLFEAEKEPQPVISRRNEKFFYSPFDKPSISRRNYLELCPDLDARLAFRSKLLSAKKKDQSLHVIGRRYSEREPPLDEMESEVGKKVRFNSYHETKSPERKPLDLSKMYDTVRFFVIYSQQSESEQQKFILEMKYDETCLEIKKSAVEKVIPGGDPYHLYKYKLVLRNKILGDSNKISDIKLRENETIYLLSDSESSTNSPSLLSSPSTFKYSNQFAPQYLIPTLTKDYNTEPSMLRISRMSEDELCRVQNFSISNEFVQVTFEGETDITGLNFDEIVQLNHRAVEIYPENGAVQIPEAGRGLNKEAVIEFYQWPVPKKYEDDVEGYTTKLKNWASSINARFEFYNPEKETLCIRVENFNMKSL